MDLPSQTENASDTFGLHYDPSVSHLVSWVLSMKMKFLNTSNKLWGVKS